MDARTCYEDHTSTYSVNSKNLSLTSGHLILLLIVHLPSQPFRKSLWRTRSPSHETPSVPLQISISPHTPLTAKFYYPNFPNGIHSTDMLSARC